VSSVHVVRGTDDVLLGAAVSELVHRLVGDVDRTLMVEELDGDDYPVSAIVDAAQTPPFLTERRVVVARNIHRFTADDLRLLGQYLDDQLPTTDLVLSAGEKLPKSFVDVVKAAGAVVVDTDVGTRRGERDEWITTHVAASGLRLDATARALVGARLGEDLGRLAPLLETLHAVYGPGARLGVPDVEPFLGEGGGVPPWDLTDAIDGGDFDGALSMLGRMLNAGDRHPLQVMAILHTHYARMLRLDGAGVHDEKSAAQVLGLKGSTYPARKALDQGRRYGHDGLVTAVRLLARADLDLRGAREWPPELVMEVLVARLCQLAPPPAPTRAGRRR
jgi:DNA polymerase III subunit delta